MGLLLMGFLCACALRAGNPGSFQRVDLVDNQRVFVVHQDPAGWLWLGTQAGLVRYDGYDTHTFRPFPTGEPMMPGNAVRAIFQDEPNILWLGMQFGGLVRFDHARQTFSHHRHNARVESSLGHDFVGALCRDGSGRLWVGTEGGGLSMLTAENTFSHIRHQPQNRYSLSSNHVTSLAPDQDTRGGFLWVGTLGGGLNHVDVRTGTARTYKNRSDEASPGHDDIHALYYDDHARLWIATGAGLARLEPGARRLKRIRGVGDTGAVWALSEDRRGRLWLAAEQGLFYLPEGGAQLQAHQQAHGGAVPGKGTIRALALDRTGVLWAGGQRTMYKLNPDDAPVALYRAETLLTNNRVHAIAEQPAGVYWLGSTGGLDRLEQAGRGFVRTPAPTGLSDNRVSALAGDARGFLWVGTMDGALGRLALSSNRVTPIQPASPSNPVTALALDEQDRLWVGRRQGLTLVDAENRPHELPLKTPVLALFSDPAGTLWIGTDLGLRRSTDGRTFPSPDPAFTSAVSALAAGADGQLWLGGLSGGLHVLEPGATRLRRAALADGPERIFAMEWDRSGALWLSCERGLYHFEPGSGRGTYYDKGLQDRNWLVGSSLRDHTGRLFFGGPGGLNVFLPEEMGLNPVPPKNRLSGISAGGREGLLFHQSEPAGNRPPPELNLTYADPDLELAVTPIHLVAPEQNRVAYQLQGHDPDWRYLAAGERLIRYQRLKPGSYQLRFKSAAGAGPWSPVSQGPPVRVSPPFRQTLPFWVLLGLGLVVLLVVLVRARPQADPAEVHGQDPQRDRDLLHFAILKEEYLVNAARELQRPLSQIVALAQTLLDRPDLRVDETARADMGLILSGSRRLADMVDNLRDLASLHQGTHTFLGDMFYPHNSIEEVLSGCRRAMEPGGVVCLNRVAREFPAVLGDEKRFRHILQHLLTFLVSAVKQGEVHIEASKGERRAHLSVALHAGEVNGDLYERARSAVEPAAGKLEHTPHGAGLGLAIAARLVMLGGERLSVDRSGRVLTFRFCRQLARAVDGVVEAMNSAPAKLFPDTGPEGVFQILVVDGDGGNRRTLETYLGQTRYQVHQAPDHLSALELLAGDIAFDVALLDVAVGEVSGYHLCREIRRTHTFYELPVIIMIQRNHPPDLRAGFQSGANDFIAKPLNREILLARIETHLRLQDAHRDLERRVARRTQQLEARNREIVRTQSNLIVQAKMASLGTLTTGIAHEIKNPLNFVTNFADINAELVVELRERLDQFRAKRDEETLDEFEEDLVDLEQNTHRIQVHGKRANQIVQSLMDVAGADNGGLADTPINMMVDEFSNMAYQGAVSRHGTRVLIQKSYDAEVGDLRVAAHNLSRVIVQLVNNAVEAVLHRAAETEDPFEPYIWVETRDKPGYVAITIRDNGTGIRPEHEELIFNPFFTTRPQGSGNIGLGLYLSYDIVVHQHHGKLLLHNEPGQGCAFTIQLPKAEPDDVG